MAKKKLKQREDGRAGGAEIPRTDERAAENSFCAEIVATTAQLSQDLWITCRAAPTGRRPPAQPAGVVLLRQRRAGGRETPDITTTPSAGASCRCFARWATRRLRILPGVCNAPPQSRAFPPRSSARPLPGKGSVRPSENTHLPALHARRPPVVEDTRPREGGGPSSAWWTASTAAARTWRRRVRAGFSDPFPDGTKLDDLAWMKARMDTADRRA
jgi:hypothetical protein